MTSGSTKKCWSCDAITPYEEGWCDTCYELIPEVLTEPAVQWTPEPFGGAIRMAIAQVVRDLRRPKRAYTPVFERKTKAGKQKLSLGDLGL
jgi:hypothetical protein